MSKATAKAAAAPTKEAVPERDPADKLSVDRDRSREDTPSNVRVDPRFKRPHHRLDVFTASGLLPPAVHDRLVADVTAIADETKDFFCPKYENIIDPNLCVAPTLISAEDKSEYSAGIPGVGRYGRKDESSNPDDPLYRWLCTSVKLTLTPPVDSSASATPPVHVTAKVTSPIHEHTPASRPGLFAGVEAMIALAYPLLATEFGNWLSPRKTDGFDDCNTGLVAADSDQDWMRDVPYEHLPRPEVTFAPTDQSAEAKTARHRARWTHSLEPPPEAELEYNRCDGGYLRQYSKRVEFPFAFPISFPRPHPSNRADADAAAAAAAAPAVKPATATSIAVAAAGAPPLRPAFTVPVETEIQVVVKAQKIVVAPGTEYRGLWHEDGMRERVIGVIVYYYSVPEAKDLEGGGMHFASKGQDWSVQFDRPGYVTSAWKKRNKVVVDIRERQMLVFSNYQTVHRVLTMRNNTTKPLTREFVCLFVIDPRHPLSVTPAISAVRQLLIGAPLPPTAASASAVKAEEQPQLLPQVLVELILQYTGEWMTRAQRLAVRKLVFDAQMQPREIAGWVLYSAGNGDCTQVTWATSTDGYNSVNRTLDGTSSSADEENCGAPYRSYK